MAMLGKRFQRTISMSHIGPGSNSHVEKAQAHPVNQAERAQMVAAGRPLALNEQELLLQAAANQWEALRANCSVQQEDHHHHHHHPKAAANQWEALKVSCSVQPDHQQQPPPPPPAAAKQWDIMKNAEAMMMKMMAVQSSSHSNDQREEGSLDQAMATENDHHIQMGLLWPHSSMNPTSPPAPHLTSPSSGLNIPRVDFLDTCFFCKRRLRHERDIFIYRGDAAFCTEECRNRQILSDETRSLRASTKKGVTTSETAVAA